jgi:hypothetical protein
MKHVIKRGVLLIKRMTSWGFGLSKSTNYYKIINKTWNSFKNSIAFAFLAM